MDEGISLFNVCIFAYILRGPKQLFSVFYDFNTKYVYSII